MTRPKGRRLLFFALETVLVALSALGIAANYLHRRIDDPRVGLLLIALSIASFFGLPIWCAVYGSSERTLERVAGVTMIGVITGFFWPFP